jgi:hypothetical protein
MIYIISLEYSVRNFILFIILFLNSTLVITAQSVYQTQPFPIQLTPKQNKIRDKTLLYIKNDLKEDVSFLIKSQSEIYPLPIQSKQAKSGPWGVISVPSQTYIKLEIPGKLVGEHGVLFVLHDYNRWLSSYASQSQKIAGGKTYFIHFSKLISQSYDEYSIHELEQGSCGEKEATEASFQQVYPYSLMSNFSIYAPSMDLTACS